MLSQPAVLTLRSNASTTSAGNSVSEKQIREQVLNHLTIEDLEKFKNALEK